ncbi:MAG: restriction endonuclease subunit S [Tunicatimonas sp.]
MKDSKRVLVASLIKEERIFVGDGYRAKNSELAEEGLPFARAGNLNNGFQFEGADCIPFSDVAKVGNKRSIVGDVAFTSKGTIGRFGFVNKHTQEFVYSPQLCFWRSLDSESINSQYLYYWMNSALFLHQVAMVSGQTDMAPYVNLRDQRRMYIDVPPLPIQKKIASILSAYDELIENNNQRIQLLETMAEEIYKEWFVRLRFPGYQDTPVVDGVPEGWEKKRLRELIEHYIGGGWGEEAPEIGSLEPAYVVRGTDIPDLCNGVINYEILRYHKKSNLKSRLLIPGDIIFEVSGGTEDQSLGRLSIVTQELLNRLDYPLICASFCKLIRSKSQEFSPFLLHSTLKRMYSTGEIKVFQVQSTGISNYQFEDFIDSQKLLEPPVEIQKKFDDIICPMYSEIQFLGAKNEVLKETRDLLLPRLISGKLSVEHLLNDDQQPERVTALESVS